MLSTRWFASMAPAAMTSPASLSNAASSLKSSSESSESAVVVCASARSAEVGAGGTGGYRLAPASVGYAIPRPIALAATRVAHSWNSVASTVLLRPTSLSKFSQSASSQAPAGNAPVCPRNTA